MHNSSHRARLMRTCATPTVVRCARGARRSVPRWLYAPLVGQRPAQKAAKAARGQQPKKRRGTVQREAIKRA
ncbi:hypothetical protein GCM10009646_34960 [Streptomyces aureus]